MTMNQTIHRVRSLVAIRARVAAIPEILLGTDHDLKSGSQRGLAEREIVGEGGIDVQPAECDVGSATPDVVNLLGQAVDLDDLVVNAETSGYVVPQLHAETGIGAVVVDDERGQAPRHHSQRAAIWGHVGAQRAGLGSAGAAAAVRIGGVQPLIHGAPVRGDPLTCVLDDIHRGALTVAHPGVLGGNVVHGYLDSVQQPLNVRVCVEKSAVSHGADVVRWPPEPARVGNAAGDVVDRHRLRLSRRRGRNVEPGHVVAGRQLTDGPVRRPRVEQDGLAVLIAPDHIFDQRCVVALYVGDCLT